MRMIQDDEETTFSLCLYGPPGTGKTTFGVSAPDPFYILSETQAVPHIRDAARMLGKRVPPIYVVENMDSLRLALVGLRKTDRSKPFEIWSEPPKEDGKQGGTKIYSGPWPKTIVLDSVTDICRLVEEEIHRIAPQKTSAKDGLPVSDQRFWQVLGTKCQGILKSFRDVPQMNKVFICLLDDKTVGEGEDAERTIRPQLPMRSLVNFIAAMVNAVGVTRRQIKAPDANDPEKQKKIEYSVMTTGSDIMLLKPYRPLRDVENTDFSDWIRRLNPEAPKQEPTKKTKQEAEVKHENQS